MLRFCRLGEFVGREMASQMIAAARRDVECAEDFLVLNVAARRRQLLRAESEFAEFARRRIARVLRILRVDRFLAAANQRYRAHASAGDGAESERAVLVFHRELALGAHGDEVNFTRRKVRHIRLAAAHEAVTFLRLLPAKFEPQRAAPALAFVVDLGGIRARHPEPQLFRRAAHLDVIDRESSAQDDVVHPVQRRAPEPEMFRVRRQRRGRRVGRDAEDDVVVRVNVAGQTERASIGRKRLVRQFAVAAAGDFVSEQVAVFQPQFPEHAAAQHLVKILHRVPLDRPFRIGEKLKIAHVARVFEIDQNADALAGFRVENGAEQPREAEWREGARIFLRGLLDGCLHGGGLIP